MIRIGAELLRAIREHGEREYPHECGGALLGRAGSGPAPGMTKWVLALEPIRLSADDHAAPRRFLITPDRYRAVEGVARAKSLVVLGFYRSRPDSPARPSEHDREHALPALSYVVVSIRRGRYDAIASWTLDDDRAAFTSEPVAEIASANR